MKQITIFLLLSISLKASATNYYVAASGNDNNSGTIASPWKTQAKVNTGTYVAGDSILFKGGDTFDTGGVLAFNAANSAGTTSKPIVVQSYGTGHAIISSTSADGITITNTAGIVLQNLTIIGNDTRGTLGVFAKNTLNGNVMLNYLKFNNLTVSGFDLGIQVGSDPADHGTSGFSNVEISNNIVKAGVTAGIATYGECYGKGYAITNVNIHNNTVSGFVGAISKDPSGNGILLGQTNTAIIENNVVSDCGAYGAGAFAIWTYDSTNIVFQHNEAYNQRSASDSDGGGFDIDGGVTNSIIQYNYAHDNQGPGFLMFSYNDGLVTKWDNNICRFNISQNDGRFNTSGIGSLVIGANSTMTNCEVYHNDVYNNLSSSAALGFFGSSIFSATGHVANNILFADKGCVLIQTIDSNPSAISIAGNTYYATGAFNIKWAGAGYSSLAAWQAATGKEKIKNVNVGETTDPLFINPGNAGGIGGYDPAKLFHYKLKNASPMIGKGLNLPEIYGLNVGKQDYYGNAIPNTIGSYDIGAYQYKR